MITTASILNQKQKRNNTQSRHAPILQHHFFFCLFADHEPAKILLSAVGVCLGEFQGCLSNSQ